MIDDVLAIHNAQLGKRHAEIGHRTKCAVQIVR
jgi:hypothetical protein